MKRAGTRPKGSTYESFPGAVRDKWSRSWPAAGAEFGHGAATALVQAVAKQNAPLRMVGVFYQKDALTFAYFKDIGIKKPSDFEGKRMGMVPGSNTALMWNAFARAAGIDTSKVRIINTEFRTFMTQWAARSFELNGNWLMGSSLQYSFEKRTGRKISFFVVSDYLPLIGHGIIVTHKTLAENPKMVKGFVRASTRAWTYLVKDTKKAVMEASKIMKANTDKAPELEYIAAAGHVVIPSEVVVPSTKGHPVGWSNPKDWLPMIQASGQGAKPSADTHDQRTDDQPLRRIIDHQPNSDRDGERRRAGAAFLSTNRG